MLVLNQNAEQPTRIGVLGTLAEFHCEPIPYDLEALVQLVSEIKPDLLCLELTAGQWRDQDFSDLPSAYRDALLPLAYQTDIVVAPIASENPPPEPRASGWRGKLISFLRSWLAYLQRTAPDPDAVNEGPRHFLADRLYGLIARLGDSNIRREWRAYRDHLVQEVLKIAGRDPGRRLLVAVNVRHCHHIRHALKKYPKVLLVSYEKL